MPKRLTKNQALALVQTKWGDSAWVHDGGRNAEASSPERRAAASDALKEHRATRPAIKQLAYWDDSVLLGEYKRALEQYRIDSKEWRSRESMLVHQALYERYSVGYSSPEVFGMRTGSGDTWEDALESAGIAVL